jgi:hypothetical protein
MEDQVTSSQKYQTPGMIPEENNYYSEPEGQRFNNPAEFDQAVRQGQVPPPEPPQPQQPGVVYNKPDFQAMREIALQQAIDQVTAKRQAFPQAQVPPQQPVAQPVPQPVPQAPVAPQPPIPSAAEPKVVYVRRNLTLAEILVVLVVSCGLVTGTQFVWNAGADVLSRIEIRDK